MITKIIVRTTFLQYPYEEMSRLTITEIAMPKLFGQLPRKTSCAKTLLLL